MATTTTTKMQKLSFQWDIKNFVDFDLLIDEFIDSPQFSATDSTKSDWKLRLYPAGFKEPKNLSLLLFRLDSGSILYTKHKIAFLNRNGSHILTKTCPKLCEPSKLTDSAADIFGAANIIEIEKNVHRFTDGGVLSVLCQTEIHEKMDGIEEAVHDKHLQMRGTSWVTHNRHTPLEFELQDKKNIIFYLPYGKLFVCLKGNIQVFAGAYYTAFQIFDDAHPEIEEVPITITFKNIKSNWNIRRSSTIAVICNDIKASVQISSRCKVDSLPNALPADITPYIQKVQSDYRNIFSQSDGGDISIVVDGKTLRVHKNILSNRCPVFQAMFSHEWQEQISEGVTIKDFDYKTILAMMEFIYYGGVDNDNGEETFDPVELLKAAHMYQLDDLKRKCEQRICQSLQKRNVASCMALGEIYELPDLIREAFAFMTSNDNMK